MTGMPREVPKPRTGFGRNWGWPLPRSGRAPELGHAMAAAHADRYFRDIPSAWCTSFAVRTSRSWPWPTVVVLEKAFCARHKGREKVAPKAPPNQGMEPTR